MLRDLTFAAFEAPRQEPGVQPGSPSCRWPWASARTRRSSAWSMPSCSAAAGRGAGAARVGLHHRSRNPGNLPLSHLNYKDLRDQNTSSPDERVHVRAGELEHRQRIAAGPAQVVDGNYFRCSACALPSAAASPDEDERPTPVAVLSHGFWQRSARGDPAIVGKTITHQPDAVHRRRRGAQGLHRHVARRRAVGVGADVDARRRAAELRLVRHAPRPVPLLLRPVARPGSPSSRRAPTCRRCSRSSSRRTRRQQGAQRGRGAAARRAAQPRGRRAPPSSGCRSC
jgi:hypothetical protein